MQVEERIRAPEMELHRWSRSMLVLRGAMAALLGLFALAFPSRTLAGVVAFVGAYFLIDGAFAVTSGFIHLFKKNRSAWPYLVEGGLSLAVGLLALGRPISFAVGALFLIAIRCLGAGITEITAGRFFSRETGAAEWPFWIAGGASLLFGIALLVSPGIGMWTLVWLLGIYGVVFGIAMFSSAFKTPPSLAHLRG